MLAGFEALDRVRRVPEVRSGDDDRVDQRLLVEHLAIVLVAFHVVLEPLERVDDPPLVKLRPDVADRANTQAGDAKHGVGQHLALGAGAKERDVDLLQASLGRWRDGGLRTRPLISALLVPGVAEESQRRDR